MGPNCEEGDVSKKVCRFQARSRVSREYKLFEQYFKLQLHKTLRKHKPTKLVPSLPVIINLHQETNLQLSTIKKRLINCTFARARPVSFSSVNSFLCCKLRKNSSRKFYTFSADFHLNASKSFSSPTPPLGRWAAVVVTAGRLYKLNRHKGVCHSQQLGSHNELPCCCTFS